MKAISIVTILGSGKVSEPEPGYQSAFAVGKALASAGFAICNGGYRGIMEASAKGAKAAQGKTIGVTARQFPGKVNPWIDEEKVMENWQDRLFGLIHTGDAYVIFDGATGTLAEFFVIWEMLNKKLIAKPFIIFGSFLHSLVTFLKEQKEMIFTPHLKLASTPEQVVEFLA